MSLQDPYRYGLTVDIMFPISECCASSEMKVLLVNIWPHLYVGINELSLLGCTDGEDYHNIQKRKYCYRVHNTHIIILCKGSRADVSMIVPFALFCTVRIKDSPSPMDLCVC